MHSDIHKNNDQLNKLVERNDILSQEFKDYHHKRKIKSFYASNLDWIYFDFSKGTRQIQSRVEQINGHYERSETTDEYNVKISDVTMSFIEVDFDEEITDLFCFVLRNLHKFEITKIKFLFQSK
jgi:hypothetical protein